jgi:hypothetical protein
VQADTADMNGSSRPRPIFSSLAEDPAKQDSIERFVLALSAHIDDLQEADVQGDFQRVVELAAGLGDTSVSNGYEILSRCCMGVRTAAEAQSAEELRKALIELTEIAHRIRLGYRGSV